jgi:hypothetical protein
MVTTFTSGMTASEKSESDIKFENEYKPGGTLSTIVGKWQA